jgi:magnesium-transporting ATPase (P-type)
MSVVVRAPDGKILVMCKGADNIVMARSSSILSLNPESLTQSPVSGQASATREDPRVLLAQHLDAFANDGLRILVLAQRELDVDSFREFQALWSQAESAIIGTQFRIPAFVVDFIHVFVFLTWRRDINLAT